MKKKWKIVLEYMVGVLLLAEVLIVAWCLPGWYGKWQDATMMNQVHLSNRAGISFQDMDSLDLAGRLKLLCHTDIFQWNENSVTYYDANYGSIRAEVLEKCQKTMQNWCEAGIFPEQCISWMNEEHLLFHSEHYIYMDTAALPVDVLIFETADNENTMVLVMDQNHNIFYYASMAGAYMEDTMAQKMGYSSWETMKKNKSEKKTQEKTQENLSEGLVSVCDAESGSMISSTEGLQCSVQLDFESFQVTVWRNIIHNDIGTGMAVVFGTERWHEFVNSFLGTFGSWESVATTDYWEYDNMAGSESVDGYKSDTSQKIK